MTQSLAFPLEGVGLTANDDVSDPVNASSVRETQKIAQLGPILVRTQSELTLPKSPTQEK